MKTTVAIIASVAFAAGFLGGLVGGHLVPVAHAAPNQVILIETDSEIATKCNFDKTVVRGPRYWACVRG